MRIVGCHVSTVLHHRFKIPTYETQIGCTGKGCWSHPRVRSLSRSGPGGHCRYPEDRVPPRTSSNSRQKTRRARMPTCPKAQGPPCVPRLRAAPGPPCVPVAPAPVSWLAVALGPPHVAWAPAPAFWLRATLKLPRVLWTGSTSCKQLNKYPLATRPS
jgi:hypothetical protein